MDVKKLGKTVQDTFSLHGLFIPRNLSVSLAKQLLKFEESERDKWLTEIAERISSQNLENQEITKEQLERVLEECIRPITAKDEEKILNVINAYDIPKIKYDICKKKYIVDTNTRDLHLDIKDRIQLFRNRFNLMWYRTLQHKLFNSLTLSGRDDERLKLIPIENLSTETEGQNIYVMGLLTQLTEGDFYLEDPGGHIKLDLKKTDYENKFITEGCIVIAEGTHTKGLLEVKKLGYPPTGTSQDLRATLGDANTFGGKSSTSCKLSVKLKTHEQQHPDDMIVFIAELWLDSSDVLEKFRIILEGYSDYPPVAFVLCGHFLSMPPNSDSSRRMREGFKNLADVIQLVPNIKDQSTFILVPGLNDPGAPRILPRTPLPNCIVEDFLKSIPNTILATNPCRIQYCTKEIVVLREDTLSKMCRNTLCCLESNDNVYEHFAASIISQSHLAPFKITTVPVYWTYDHALHLFPAPDVILIADQFESYSHNYLNCNVINPGLFSRNKFSFQVYVPATNAIEDCEVPARTEDS